MTLRAVIVATQGDQNFRLLRRTLDCRRTAIGYFLCSLCLYFISLNEVEKYDTVVGVGG